MTPELFDATGYALIPDVLNPAECEAISDRIRSDTASGGTRRLLDNDWCMELAKRLRGSAAFSGLLDAAHVAVQCTYFEKSASRNWLVPIHQDLSIPVAQRVAEPTLSGWSEKEGSLYVQAPVALLEQLVAVRVHLDTCSEEDGPLRVVPGSHRHGVIAAEDVALPRGRTPGVVCVTAQGTAMAMRPLLLHASSKATGRGRRRVLHFLFGPATLAHGLRWQQAV